MADTRFKGGWTGEKACKRCSATFRANSGSQRFCQDCRQLLRVCPQCGDAKSEYHQFCGNSCAGKWKFATSASVREAIESGRTHPNQAIGRLRGQRARKGKPMLALRGERNPNWRGGGQRDARHTFMGRVEYINWRKAVFARDDFTCQVCGQRGGRLNADHIKPYLHRPDLALDLSNGRTLCESCHRKTPTWGEGAKRWLENPTS